MSQIGYANPAAAAPGLGPLDTAETEASEVRRRRARLAAAVPLIISVTAHWVFFIAYWMPETSTFPAHQWWLTQLSPLVSKGLTSDGASQVPAQELQGGVPGLLLLIAGALLLWLSRTRHWWGRAVMVVPTAIGLLVVLVSLIALVASSAFIPSAVGVLLLLGWAGSAGYATYHGRAAGQAVGDPKTWRSGLAFLVAYALIGPAPAAVGRCLFGGGLRDAAVGLQENTVSLRLAGLLTPSTLLLYGCGLLVGLTVWVGYQWWPPRPRLSSVWLTLALVLSLLCTGWLGWPANTSAEKRTTTLLYASPARAKSFPCGAVVLGPGPAAGRQRPAVTVAASGFRCRTVTTYSAYRQLSTLTLPASVSPVKASTPEGLPIVGKLVSAEYDGALVLALSERLDGRAGQLIALRDDGTELWTYTCSSRNALAVRFARVPAGDQPALGHLTLAERGPRVVVGCDGRISTFDPVDGPAG